MPLPVLIALVIGGIAGIALILHLSGRSRVVALTEVTARAAWLRHFPDDRVARDSHAASSSPRS
jgi:hypothetical protein